MKHLFIAFFMLLMAACTTTPGTRTEWIVDQSNKAELDKFWGAYNQCKDFAFQAKVAGSRYEEHDIHMSCIQRKGWSMKTTQITE